MSVPDTQLIGDHDGVGCSTEMDYGVHSLFSKLDYLHSLGWVSGEASVRQ